MARRTSRARPIPAHNAGWLMNGSPRPIVCAGYAETLVRMPRSIPGNDWHRAILDGPGPLPVASPAMSVSLEHQGIIDMFRENPSLAPHLIEKLFHVQLPPHASAKVVESTLDQMIPIEFSADLVLELLNEQGEPVLLIVLEMQRAIDHDKEYTWPVYVTVVRAKRRCQAIVLVVAPDENVAAWASEKIDLGLGLGTIQPLVLGPAVVPQVTDPTEAEKETELAILSAVAHGNGPNGLAVVTAAFMALARLDPQHAAVYFQIIWNVLREPMQRALQELVMERQTQGKVEFPPFIQQIADRSELKGRVEEAARAVLTVLRARGIAVPDTARERLLAQKDPDRLERWLEKAAVAASFGEVLDDPS